MISHFKKIKLSISELSLEDQLELHRKIRAARLVFKAPAIRQRQTTKEKTNRKLDKLLSNMTDVELEEMEKMINAKKT